MSILQKRHYEFIAKTIARIPDERARAMTLTIFCDDMSRESFKFKEDLFRKFVLKHTNAN